MAKRRKKKAMNARRRMMLKEAGGRRNIAAQALQKKQFRPKTVPDRRKKESREACRGNKKLDQVQ